MDAAKLLRQIPLFKECREADLGRLAAICEEEVHPEGRVIFREGETGDALYAVLEGTVRISKLIPRVGEEAMAFLEEGGHFGEMALLDEAPRSATAIAHTDCRLLIIRKTVFLDLLKDEALARQLLLVFCRTLSYRLRETTDRIVTLFAFARQNW
ncbi:MAG TPA: cyclic nucleotide-binding domain-containing protein [Candidatus Methylomirabilis sp.]|jgi:CRP-like cAMP-binding protein|nr:cyclic nucleotide-binding domain-containing protein [Candidatus Methylomirabilis sp.]